MGERRTVVGILGRRLRPYSNPNHYDTMLAIPVERYELDCGHVVERQQVSVQVSQRPISQQTYMKLLRALDRSIAFPPKHAIGTKLKCQKCIVDKMSEALDG